MANPTSRVIKGAIILCFMFLVLLQKQELVRASGIADETERLAERVKSIGDAFMQQSFELRLKYEYYGSWSSDADRENLYNLAKKASDDLQVISKVQQSLKTKIESYQEPDWEDKYGVTGLWRKLTSDIFAASFSKSHIDFYLALASDQQGKNRVLHDILTQIDSLGKVSRSAELKFLEAKATAELAKTELAYMPAAIYQLDALAASIDIPESIRFKASIEKIKLTGKIEKDKLDELLNKLAASRCRDEMELVLSLAFLQRKNDSEAFEKIVQKWPQAEEFLASRILPDISDRIAQQQQITHISTFEAELAALAAWKNNTQKYARLLDKLTTVEKFQTPLILYVAGLAYAESSPVKSIDFLIRAGRLQQLHKDSRLNVEPDKIAERAARLAYNLFVTDSSKCMLAIKTFENYSDTAGDKIDSEMEYLYSLILNNCGQTEKARQLLQKITDRPAAGAAIPWRNRARLDLIIKTILQNPADTIAKTALLEQLNNLIADCPPDDESQAELRTEAVNMYCQLLLESKDTSCAQKVLDVLSDSETAGPSLYLFKSEALLYLDKIDESAQVLLDVNDPNCAGFYEHSMELLAQVCGEIDLLQTREENFPQIIRNCEKIAQVCYDCFDDQQKQQAGMYLAEIIIFSAENRETKLSQAGRLLSSLAKNSKGDNLDLLVCQARLLTEQGNFEEAAKLWAKICKSLEARLSSSEQHSNRWWTAKFYELYCGAKTQKISQENILHSIEVLENSFANIPLLWTEKLRLLKQQCSGKGGKK